VVTAKVARLMGTAACMLTMCHGCVLPPRHSPQAQLSALLSVVGARG
jgi:hypothetical protein